ncbi:hypothetical protein [Sphingomonas alba]|uniref:Glycosyltransferase RgtA/B/C/D-like domain-containing protein n=1 Tax=Sphingomonas alba TaxID=2908208 RepID=A0ABT0RPB3_9SPHN|nr:hypothetical protein [Sphingomonas alba]MCL6684497.1 hypothetical protein [Sphingomonas alba]
MSLSVSSGLGSRILKSLALTWLLILPVVMGASPRIFADGDTSWHVAAGNWILAHHRVPEVDPFSFTMQGHPWVAFEWLSEIIYASAYNLAGLTGLTAVVMMALLALHAVVFLYLFRKVTPLGLVCALVAMDVIIWMFLFARPHVLVWPVLALWTAILLYCRDEGRTPPLILALLMVLWVNLHASFVLGFMVAGGIALDALIAARWNRDALLGWLKFGLVAVAAAFINANGVNGVVHPFNVMRMGNLAFIAEWSPSNPSITPGFYAILIFILGLSLWRGLKLKLGEILILSFLLFMAFYQVRHQSWLGIVAPLILTPRLSTRIAGGEKFLEQRVRPMAVTIAALALVGFVGRMAWPIPVPDHASNPRALLAHVPPPLRSKPVFNGYSFGGPLILAGIRPYIDGRSEMYGDQFVADYVAMQEGDMGRFNAAVRKYGIEWTILPQTSKLARALDASPDWRRTYADKIGIIHVRAGRAPKVASLSNCFSTSSPFGSQCKLTEVGRG